LTEKFNLFVGQVQEIPDKAKYYYFSAEAGYILVYAQAESLEGFVLVDENEVTLTYNERVWLASCKLQENTKAIKEPKFLEMLEAFVADMENLRGGETNGG
jgi:hypothetical protein